MVVLELNVKGERKGSLHPVESSLPFKRRAGWGWGQRAEHIAPRPSLHKHLIHITPSPALIGLERLDDRVSGCMEMLGRVLVLRRIAAAYVTAGQAQAQMQPAV